MSQKIQLEAEPRTDVGKGASRRLRRKSGRVPGIMYGGKDAPEVLSFDGNTLSKAMQLEAFFSQILTIKTNGKAQQAVVRDVQRHPASESVLHIDFLRISADRQIHVHVPIHFLNEEDCVGVRLGGGSISHNVIEVEVSCLPANLPEYIEVDVGPLELSQSVHLSDLALPEGVEIVELQYGEDHDHPVVSVQPPRGGAEAEGEEAADEEPIEAAPEEEQAKDESSDED